MPVSALALVILAGLIHACWNIAAKKAGGDVRFSFFSSVVMMVFWAPVGLWLGWQQVPGWGVTEWGFVFASGVIHSIYFVVLFFQSIAVLFYGLVIRSRSLTFTPTNFAAPQVALAQTAPI